MFPSFSPKGKIFPSFLPKGKISPFGRKFSPLRENFSVWGIYPHLGIYSCSVNFFSLGKIFILWEILSHGNIFNIHGKVSKRRQTWTNPAIVFPRRGGSGVNGGKIFPVGIPKGKIFPYFSPKGKIFPSFSPKRKIFLPGGNFPHWGKISQFGE